MEYSKLIQKIENGKQVGITGFINTNDREFFYTYAIQKINGKYVSYTSEYYWDELDYDFPEQFDHFEVYETLSEVLEIFKNKYNIRPEDLNTSRGNKFFNEIKLVRYIGETKSLMLTHNKIYNVIFTEKNLFHIVDDGGEDCLYPSELFEEL